jgi:allantoinase
VLLNSDVCERYPQIIEAGRTRDWAWLAHGKTNSMLQTGMPVEEERALLRDVVDTIEKATGQRPRGWLGTGLTETFKTPELLAERGLSYLLDWTNDDQPYPLNVPGMLSVPYSVELMIKDQFDQLYADSADSGRVMALALHPFVIGQPFRHKYLDQALGYIANHPGVWLTTSDEIAEHYTLTQTTADVAKAGTS